MLGDNAFTAPTQFEADPDKEMEKFVEREMVKNRPQELAVDKRTDYEKSVQSLYALPEHLITAPAPLLLANKLKGMLSNQILSGN